jgi:hypothetical protein
MSAIPPKADIPQSRLDVRFVPKRISTWLFDSTGGTDIPRSGKLQIFNIPDSAS